jgi:hypothetical protein
VPQDYVWHLRFRLEQVVDVLIRYQQQVLDWWDANVRAPGNQPNISAPEIIGAAAATAEIGFTPVQISRMRKALEDPDYRAGLIEAAHVEAGAGRQRVG